MLSVIELPVPSEKGSQPEIYPERLSDLISCIIGTPVKVVKVLPLQESMLEGKIEIYEK